MLISAGTVATGTELLRPGWLEIVGDRVADVGQGRSPRPADVHLADALVVPGFVDMHVHGGGGGAFPTASPEDARTAIEMHRRHGTTSMVASLVTATPSDLLRQVAVMAELTEQRLIVGSHLEGPWLSADRGGAHELSQLRDPERNELERVFAAGRGTVRMVTLAPEREHGLSAIRRVVDAGAVAAIGHTDATYDQAKAAVDAGATVGTHLFNAMRPVHHREPGPVIALLEDPRVTVELITDGVHLHPALYRDVTQTAGPNRVALVTDAMVAAGMPDGAYHLGGLAVNVQNGIARLAGATTIAGSTATMDAIFRYAIAHSALEFDAALRQAVRQTSVNPAAALGLPPVGLAAGRPADLVVLDADLAVRSVLAGGQWVTPASHGRPTTT